MCTGTESRISGVGKRTGGIEMSAFALITNLFSHFRQVAQAHDCNPCMDHAKETILQMNEKGRNEQLFCLMPIEIQCPCGGLDRMLQEKGECTKGVFRKL